MISEKTIEDVKAAAEILDVVKDFLTLKKKGTDYSANCPFHSEKTPSFVVSPVKGIYKCFGCGKSGDAIAFVMEHQRISYIDAIQYLAKKYNIEVEAFSKKEFVKPVARLEKLGDRLLTWFETERKISNNTLLRFGITESKEWMPDIKTETTVACFNYYRDETLVNIKFRGPKKSFKLAKDAELIFYNLDSIKGKRECIIVEGEIGCMSMYESGFYNVVSVPNGAAAGSLKLEYLDNCYEYFAGMEKVILAVDADASGSKLRDELARRLGLEKCYQVRFPEGCKDANDVLVKLGAEALKDVIDSAVQWPIAGIVEMESIYADMVEYYENGYPQGYKARIQEFDEMLSFYPGQLTVVTGIPGSGKSEFVDLIMTSLSRFHGFNWAVCSFETPPAFHATKLAEKFTNKSFSFRKDPAHRIDAREFEYSVSMIDKHFHFINMSLVDVTMDGLLAKAEELVKRKGITGLLFDPWNCIEAKYGNESETKYVLTCLNKLINFLDKYKVHCILVAHPTKLQKNKQTNKYNVPTMYDISGSAHFFNRTHNGISVYRDFETGIVDIYVQKVKWSWLGKIGFCSFNFNTLTREYEPLGGSSRWSPTNES